MAQVIPNSSLTLALKNIHHPHAHSHKGQNGKMLVIGGSHIFHAASLWAAEVATHFVDLVHYSSTEENMQVIVNLKTKFANGIVIPKNQIPDYVREDDVILVGPGMERGKVDLNRLNSISSFEQIMALDDEASYTYSLIKFLVETYPHKQFVFDAGALQMMNPSWLKKLQTPAIITPHTREFETLFKISLLDNEKNKSVISTAEHFSCIILLKNIDDTVSDGNRLVTVTGGNAGLSKGGSGDTLAGLISAFTCVSDPFSSCITASYILKTASEKLFKTKKTFYNTSDLIKTIPYVAGKLIFDN